MILPKTKLAKIEKGKFDKIVGNLIASKFSGYIKVAYKKLELYSGEILFDSGKIIAAEIIKIRSKSKIYGDIAISELITLDNSVVEIYPLDPAQAKKAVEMNQIATLKEISMGNKPEEIVSVGNTTTVTRIREGTSEIEREKIMKKYRIIPPENGEIRNIIQKSVGNSELFLEIDETLKSSKPVNEEKEKILQKYSIKKPAEEEVELLISNALGIEEAVDFDNLKKELIELITSKIGKPSKKTVSIIESCNSYDELIEKRSEIEKSLRSLIMFIPREKINMLIAEIEEKIGWKPS
ncbi:MAG: DUF2226 domain-containing protein [Chitinispirillaceae bacterium]|nr:DUF2226 domain-containing protein [Chitinispirillaceae bacterium]